MWGCGPARALIATFWLRPARVVVVLVEVVVLVDGVIERQIIK